LLTAPAHGIGTASLVVIEPTGVLRSVTLAETQAGTDTGDEGSPPDFAKMRQNIPALAVEPAAGRAFVIPANGSVAEVSLSTLADTNTWGTKLIDRGADSCAVDGDSLLVTGSTWSDSDRTGMGLAVYGFDGARKLSVFRGDAARVVLAFRGKAYVDLGRPYTARVVDLTSGRILADRHAPLARLLIGDGST